MSALSPSSVAAAIGGAVTLMALHGLGLDEANASPGGAVGYERKLLLSAVQLGLFLLHGVLFFVQFVLAGTSSGTPADVRESDRGERDSSLSGGRLPEISENVVL